MNVRISGYAWIKKGEFTKDQLEEVKLRLTIKPKRTHQKQEEPSPITLYGETDSEIGIPRGYFMERRQLQHDIAMDVSTGNDVDLTFNGQLRPYQEPPVDVILRNRESGGLGGIIQAPTGSGKTVLCLNAWTKMGTNALVVVNKGFLQDQWVKRIKGSYSSSGKLLIPGFVPNARVGIIRGNKCEYGSDFDISIATIQTLSRRKDKFPSDFWRAFGLVITDEVHRIGAPSWCDVIPRFESSYRLGVSATPRRKDGAESVFFYHIGEIIYTSKVSCVTPKLRRVFTSFVAKRTPNFNPNAAGDEILKRWLVKNPARNKLIVQELLQATKAKRKVIVLSERIKHLEILKEMFDKKKDKSITTSFYVGGMKRAELDDAEGADVIFSSYAMTEEGFDVADLDTAFLVMPRSDVEQSVGRIMREYGDKKAPIVVDFIDDGVATFSRLWNRRREFYMAKGMYNPE